MKTNEALKLLEDKNFLDKIYHFSYHRCSTSFEAEDLCSDIILAVILAIHKQEHIKNFYAFVWTIARRVYADFCQRRNSEHQIFSIENGDFTPESTENETEMLIEKAADKEQIGRIFREIAFLSKAYREVMIMFYIDELKVKEIAEKLNINENTVKQRLFSARNSIRKEVETMNKRNCLLKPIKLVFMGTGSSVGNNPAIKAERLFSQNLIYLCKEKPKSARELSEELCIPTPYIEEELEIQCHGENGKYGMLRKLDSGKYAINIHLVDYEEYDRANRIFEKHLPEICRTLRDTLKKNEKTILSFPYLSEQKDLHFIMWSLISRIIWNLGKNVNQILAQKYFSDITPINRNFSCVAVAYTGEQKPLFDFYGCNEISAICVGGYRSVQVANIYGKHIEKHFSCEHNIAMDQKLLMVLKSIGGISVDVLSESEKEVVAKGIECGYLFKNGNRIEPKIIVIEKKDEKKFYDLSLAFNEEMKSTAQQIAAEFSEFIHKNIPEHLMNEYQIYTELLAGIRIISKIIDACIDEGLLKKPKNRVCAEGMWMIAEK